MAKVKRVNLGCGTDYIPGWINVDIDTDFKVDVVADLSEKFPFADNSIDEIKASDIIEHFTKEDGEKFLEECYRVLKIDGIITIRTHNIFQIFRQFQNDPQVLIHFLYGDTSGGIFGVHKYGYMEESLRILLIKLGFTILSFQKETTNFVVTAKKQEKKQNHLTIGIIMQSPDIGGAEMYMLWLIREFLQKKNEVLIASNKEKFFEKAKQFTDKTYEIPMILDINGNYRGLMKTILLLPYATYYYCRLLKEFKKQNISVILMSNFTEKLFVTFLSVFFKIPVVWIEYGRLEIVFKRNFYIPKIVYRLFKNIPKRVIVPSKNTMGSLITDARVSLSKLEFIPLGIPFSKKNSHRIQRFPELKNKFVIGNVSRLTREKGQEHLIKAMPNIIKKMPNAHLLLVGEGPNKEYYMNLVNELHIESHVSITGFINDLNTYYAQMDIFIFPTVWEMEGFGLVTLEAMSHKLPVIASNIGPVPEIVIDGRTGLLVPPGDEQAIASAIIVLSKNLKKRKLLGENGYKRFNELYVIEISADKVLDVLNDSIV